MRSCLLLLGLFFSILLLVSFSGCAFKLVTRSKNIQYLQADSLRHGSPQQLNVFAPHKRNNLKEVLIFVYGGSWRSGKRSLYSFLGNRLARKDIVTVIVDYPKSPAANYEDMAVTVAAAVKWTKENIQAYGGDTANIFIAGHSAGGHLAALITTEKKYFSNLGLDKPIRGTILIDPAGLDMYRYLQDGNFGKDSIYLGTFTRDPERWKDASPLYFVHEEMPPVLLYNGEKTYPAITTSSEKFVKALQDAGNEPVYKVVPHKKHIAMITQFLNSGNKRYTEIIGFMKKNAVNNLGIDNP